MKSEVVKVEQKEFCQAPSHLLAKVFVKGDPHQAEYFPVLALIRVFTYWNDASHPVEHIDVLICENGMIDTPDNLGYDLKEVLYRNRDSD